MRAVTCVLLVLAGSLSIPRTGSRLVVKACTGLSRQWVTLAGLSQVLSRDTLSVHCARAATHWDGAGLEGGGRRFHTGSICVFSET